MSCAGPVDFPLLAPLREGFGRVSGLVGYYRQSEAEARAAKGRLVVRPDLSAMRFDD